MRPFEGVRVLDFSRIVSGPYATQKRDFKPRELNLDIYFRRPIFRDDSVAMMVDKQNGVWKAICLTKCDKVATEARINTLVSG